MRKIKLYIAISLNGKIAKADGSVDWLDAMPKPDGSDYGYNEFYNSVDTTIQGYNTYKQILSWGIEFPYKGKRNYVLTSDASLEDNRDVTFVSANHIDFVKELKEMSGQDIWLIGGGATNTALLNAKLIDEIYLYVMPIILNEGIDIFAPLENDKSIELKHSKTYTTGVVEMIYQL
ncbi:MAG: dihydrofolate reductase family protein [Cyanobacteria bacterium P01_G01_bin.49]